jgi:hypothetical protein
MVPRHWRQLRCPLPGHAPVLNRIHIPLARRIPQPPARIRRRWLLNSCRTGAEETGLCNMADDTAAAGAGRARRVLAKISGEV